MRGHEALGRDGGAPLRKIKCTLKTKKARLRVVTPWNLRIILQLTCHTQIALRGEFSCDFCKTTPSADVTTARGHGLGGKRRFIRVRNLLS